MTKQLRLFLLSLCFLGLSYQDHPITIYMIGDSTMAEKLPEKRPETGWGEMFQQVFDSTVVVSNHARNGRSTRTFIQENRWQPIVDSLKEGDYVFIQFGHNDQAKEKVDRYTPPGDYKTNLLKFIAETRAKKAIPVLLTSIMRRRFNDKGEFYDVHGEYPDTVRSVAAQYDVPLIDLHRLSEKVITEYGVEGSKKLFLNLQPGENPNYPNGVNDNTHFTPLGAETWARLAAEEIRRLNLDLAKRVR